MRKSGQTASQKQQNFRIQIRRRQIDQFFRLCRHQLQQLSIQQSIKICKNNFRELQTIFDNQNSCERQSISNNNSQNAHKTPPDHNYHQILHSAYLCDSSDNNDRICMNNNLRLQILLKQLRDINCMPSMMVTQIFVDSKNLAILLKLHDCEGLTRICQQFILQMLLNISSFTDQQCKKEVNSNSRRSSKKQPPQDQIIQLQSLNIKKFLKTNNRYCIILMLQIVSNLLVRDRTSQTMYDLIKKYKIYQYILQFLVDRQRRQIYDIIDIRQTFMWFVNRILLSTIRYNFTKIQSDFPNVVEAFYSEVMKDVKSLFQNTNGSQSGSGRVNNLFLYMKTLIKSQLVELQQQVIQKLNNIYFSPTYLHYLEYLGTLTYHTLFRLQRNNLQELLQFLLTNPSSIQSPSILRCVANSLTNDSTDWRIVLEYFIKYSQIGISDQNQDVFQHQGQLNSHTSSFMYHFAYFLNQGGTQPDMAQIIKIIICGQGGLGIFQQSIQVIGKSEHMRQILIDLGFDD